MASRLSDLDCEQRENTISKMHQILDDDYKLMGFEINNQEENNIIR